MSSTKSIQIKDLMYKLLDVANAHFSTAFKNECLENKQWKVLCLKRVLLICSFQLPDDHANVGLTSGIAWLSGWPEKNYCSHYLQ